MFSFEVNEVGDECRQAKFNIKSDNFTVSFIPEANLPKYKTIDVNAAKGKLVFCKYDGFVSLEWDEKNVYLSLSSFGCDKGSMDVQVTKADDSLKKALIDWIDFQTKESALEVTLKEIDQRKTKKIKSFEDDQNLLLMSQKKTLEEEAQHEKNSLKM